MASFSFYWNNSTEIQLNQNCESTLEAVASLADCPFGLVACYLIIIIHTHNYSQVGYPSLL